MLSLHVAVEASDSWVPSQTLPMTTSVQARKSASERSDLGSLMQPRREINSGHIASKSLECLPADPGGVV